MHATAISTLVPEAKETQPDTEGDHDQHVKGLLLQELSPMRGRHIELQKLVNSQQKLVNSQTTYIKRLARECAQTWGLEITRINDR